MTKIQVLILPALAYPIQNVTKSSTCYQERGQFFANPFLLDIIKIPAFSFAWTSLSFKIFKKYLTFQKIIDELHKKI